MLGLPGFLDKLVDFALLDSAGALQLDEVLHDGGVVLPGPVKLSTQQPVQDIYDLHVTVSWPCEGGRELVAVRNDLLDGVPKGSLLLSVR